MCSRRTGDAGRGSGRREYFDMERGAGGGAGERALEQVFKQRVSGDARLNRSSGGANPGTPPRTGRVRGGAQSGDRGRELARNRPPNSTRTCMMTKQ
jgi:hypothetical protein